MSEPAKSAQETQDQKPASPVQVVKKVIEVLKTEEEKSAEGVFGDNKPASNGNASPSIESLLEGNASILKEVPVTAPWTLEQFFKGEIDLDIELNKRFHTMPMMSTIQFRTLGTQSARRVATLGTQDGSASFLVEVDLNTRASQFTFTLGSMLSLRFHLNELSDMDRTRWVELMKREQGGLTFLWGANRWARDYLVCISRRNHTNLFAFSPHNFEAGVRLTPPVMKQLLAWLDNLWTAQTPPKGDSAPILTW